MESTTDIRKGKCSNVGVCSKANVEEIQEIEDVFADLICVECGGQLELIEEITEEPKGPNKKIIFVIIGVVLVGLISFLLFSGDSRDNSCDQCYDQGYDCDDEGNCLVDEPMPELRPTTPEPTPVSMPEPTPVSSPKSNIPNLKSLDEYFDFFENENADYDQKMKLKSKFINDYFVNNSVKVIEFGNNNTLVDEYTIDNFVEHVISTGTSFTVIEKKNKSGKIVELHVKF
jgi:hypothetical protein